MSETDIKQEPTSPSVDEEEFTSPEDEELKAVLAEVAAAENSETEGEGHSPEENAENQKQVPEAETEQNAQPDNGKTEPDTPMVPLPALKSERAARQQAEREIAEMRGYIAALQDGAKPQEAAPPEPTPAETLASLREEQRKAAALFDDGDLTTVEYETRRQEIDDKIYEVRESLRPQPSPAPTQAPMMDSRVEENLIELNKQFPVLKVLDAGQLAPFEQQARANAEAAGQPFSSGALETMRLHKAIAEAAHAYYAQFFPSAPAPVTPKGELSPDAKAREAKLEVARTQPPNTTQMGSTDSGPMNEAELLTKLNDLDEEEAIAFLDASGMAKTLLK